MQQHINILIDRLNDAFRGKTWYGISFIDKVNDIDWTIVNKTPFESANSIAKLVKHCMNWRYFAIEKLNGNATFDIELNTPQDWTEITITSQKDWTDLVTELKRTQQGITTILSTKNDAFLDKTVPGKPYNFLYLIEGVIQHDVYHLGQIAIVEKLSR